MILNVFKLNFFFYREVGGERGRETIESTSVEKILMTSERVLEASGDPGEMVKQARLLGQATAQLIQSIKVILIHVFELLIFV